MNNTAKCNGDLQDECLAYPRTCARCGLGPCVRGAPPALSTPEPAPVANRHPPVWPLVMRDMAERDHTGRAKYGTPLQPHNGRDALVDAYQEALDLVVYLRQAIYERDGG